MRHAAARDARRSTGGCLRGTPPFALPAVACLLVGALLAGPAGAQDPPGTLRGTVVVAGADVPLPYAAVLVGEPPAERFVDLEGRFVVRGLAAGAHRVRVRRIGYRPLDTSVVVRADAPPAPLRVALVRLPQQLAAVRVAASGSCRAPGPPRADADPEFAALFEQMEQNAEQYRLLVRAHPFSYAMERRLLDRLRSGRERVVRADTIVLGAEAEWRYAPGAVVGERETSDGARERVLNLPTLVDFADPAFQRTHCFHAGGLAELDGRATVRIDFRAAASLRAPDVDGAIYLDAASYQIVAAELSLTRAGDAMRGVEAVTVRTGFREIAPGVPIVESVAAEHRMARGGSLLGASERQRLLEVRFDATPLPIAAPPD